MAFIGCGFPLKYLLNRIIFVVTPEVAIIAFVETLNSISSVSEEEIVGLPGVRS